LRKIAVTTNPEQQPETAQHKPTRQITYFWGAMTVAALSITALFVWPTIDASYRYARWLAQVDLGLETVKGASPAEELGLTKEMLRVANGWDALGLRVTLLLLLYSIALAATVSMLVSCIRWRSSIRVIAVLGICSCWLCLLGTYTWVERWSIRHHASGILPQVEIAAAALKAQWPTKNGTIAPDLHVLVSDEHPNLLFVMGRKAYPIREDFGYLIDRSENGAIRFKLKGAFDCNLEFHPPGSEPKIYLDGFGNESSTVRESTELKKQWFLVQYGDS
jgi:hypothetical protein